MVSHQGERDGKEEEAIEVLNAGSGSVEFLPHSLSHSSSTSGTATGCATPSTTSYSSSATNVIPLPPAQQRHSICTPTITTILLNTVTTTTVLPNSSSSSSISSSSEQSHEAPSPSPCEAPSSISNPSDSGYYGLSDLGSPSVAEPAEGHSILETSNQFVLEPVERSRSYSVDKENQLLLEFDRDKSDLDMPASRNGEMMSSPPEITCCAICYDRSADYELHMCKHRFCMQCLRDHCTTKVFEGAALGITCPDCHVDISLTDIENLLLPDVLVKYRTFKKLAALRSDPNCRWCPKPDCETPVIGNPMDPDFPCLECPKCSTKFCFDCNTRWHPKIPCKKNIEMLRKKGLISTRDERWKKKNSKKCPRCRTDIEKDAGCNHIVCTSCSFQFCWLCMGEYTPGHYETGACANKCFEPGDDDLDFLFGRPRTPLQKVLNVGKGTLIVIGGVVVAAVTIPIGVAILPFWGAGLLIGKMAKGNNNNTRARRRAERT